MLFSTELWSHSDVSKEQISPKNWPPHSWVASSLSWLEHCTGLVEVMGSNPIQWRHLLFFRCTCKTMAENVQQVWGSFLQFISHPQFSNISFNTYQTRNFCFGWTLYSVNFRGWCKIIIFVAGVKFKFFTIISQFFIVILMPVFFHDAPRNHDLQIFLLTSQSDIIFYMNRSRRMSCSSGHAI